MGDRLTGPRVKVARAKEHISELHAELTAFNNRKPYRLRVKDDPETGDRVYWVEIREQLGEHPAAVLGDIFHNLRSSLDLLAWQLVAAGRGIPTSARQQRSITFPIGDSRQEFESAGLKKVNRASEEAKNLLREIKPYKGGNDSLWRLHHLNRADKHRLIAVVAGAYRNVTITLPLVTELPQIAEHFGIPIEEVPRQSISLKPADRKFPLKDGDEVYIVKGGARETAGDEHPQIAIEVAFGQSEIVEGEPVFPTVDHLASAVEQTVELFAPLL